MNQPGKIIKPEVDQVVENYHNSKYKVFHKMYDDERSYNENNEGEQYPMSDSSKNRNLESNTINKMKD